MESVGRCAEKMGTLVFGRVNTLIQISRATIVQRVSWKEHILFFQCLRRSLAGVNEKLKDSKGTGIA